MVRRMACASGSTEGLATTLPVKTEVFTAPKMSPVPAPILKVFAKLSEGLRRCRFRRRPCKWGQSIDDKKWLTEHLLVAGRGRKPRTTRQNEPFCGRPSKSTN